MPKLCVPLVKNSPQEIVQAMEKAKQNADILEIWFGELFTTSPINLEEANKIIAQLQAKQKELGNIPLLFTIKDKKEQGNFAGTHDEKKQLAKMLWNAQVDYLDLDYEFDVDFFEMLKTEKTSSKTQLILSAHFFEGTPSFPSLKNRIQRMQNRGADIIKIAAQPQSVRDVIDILRLAENLHRQNIKFIVLSMGNLGKITRIMTPLWGGEMMFAPIELQNSSASGQIEAKTLQKLWAMLEA